MIQYVPNRFGKPYLVHKLLTPMEEKAHTAWLALKERCNNPNSKAYRNYGGRGIKISPEYAGDFARFASETGLPPGPEFSLERIKGDLGYQKGNLKWALIGEQNRNRSNNRWVSVGRPEKVTIAEAAEIAGVSFDAMWRRVEAGWTGADLLLGRWGSAAERKDELLEIEGVTKTVAEWAVIAKMSYFGFRQRMKRGVTGKALLEPSRTRKHCGFRKPSVAQEQ